jgi:hypothetical protein
MEGQAEKISPKMKDALSMYFIIKYDEQVCIWRRLLR